MPAVFAKKRGRGRFPHPDDRLPEDEGDPTSTGVAVMLGVFEIVFSFVILLFSQNYYLFIQVGIQFLTILVESYDLFAGFLVVAYILTFEILSLLTFIAFETFRPNRSIIHRVFNGVSESGRLWIIVFGYFLVFWCVFRLYWTRRAMHFIYMARYEKRRSDALKATMHEEGFVIV